MSPSNQPDVPVARPANGMNLFVVVRSRAAQALPGFAKCVETSLHILGLILAHVEQVADQQSPITAFDQDVWQTALNHVPLLRPFGHGSEEKLLSLRKAEVSQVLTSTLLGGGAPEKSGQAAIASWADGHTAVVWADLKQGLPFLVHLARVRVAEPEASSTIPPTTIETVALQFAPVVSDGGRKKSLHAVIRTGVMRLDLTPLDDPAKAQRLAFVLNADQSRVVDPQRFLAVDCQRVRPFAAVQTA
jgi:hypothetical protein